MVSIGSQFSTGEQNHAIRERFWAGGFKTCQNVLCPSATEISVRQELTEKNQMNGSIISEDHIAGCRMNGDGYGTAVFKCSICGWKTSFQYDEASEPYYYETRFWEQYPKPPPPPHRWDTVNVRSWLQSINIDPKIISKCTTFGLLHGPTLCDMNKQKLQALTFTKEEAEIVLNAVSEKDKEFN